MQAIILAAGMGKRLKELTRDNTKCMVRVNGVTLIDRMLHQIDRLSLSRVVIVVGYEGQKLIDYIGTLEDLRTPIEFIDNPIYDKTNNIYSLSLAKDRLCREDTLLFESDIIFEDAVLDALVSDPRETLALVAKYEPWMDGTCVRLNEQDEIIDFVPGRKFEFAEKDGYYKTVNLYKFSRRFSQNYYVPFLEAYQAALGQNEYYEQVLRVITMLDQSELRAKRLAGEKWYEIDDIQDLDIAESLFAEDEERVRRLQRRYGGYWRYPRMLDFCYLVNPFYPPRKLKDEMRSCFDELLTQYPSGMQVNSLLAGKNFALHAENILVGNGAAELIKALMEHLSGKTGFIRPTFEEYPNRYDPEKAVNYIPANRDFAYTAEDLIRFFDGKNIASLILVNPDNPSGNYIPKAGLLRLTAWAKEKGITLVVDESFADFADEPENTLLSQKLLEENPHLIVVKSISKSYGVPGVRLGVLASGNTELIARMKKEVAIWNINSFGEFFLQIAEKYRKDYAFGLERLRAERIRFAAGLSEIPALRVIPSQANYLMVEVQGPVTPAELVRRLLIRHDILIKDLTAKAGGRPYLRLAIRTPEENDILVAALKRELLPIDRAIAEAVKISAQALDVGEAEIEDMTPMKKGMTNHSFVFTCRGERYIMRIPGEGTDRMINRVGEKQAYDAIKGLGISDEVLYLDPKTGYKLSRYIENAETCDCNNDEDVVKMFGMLHRIRRMQLKTETTWDIFREMERYESLWQGPSIYRDYEEVKRKILTLRPYIEAHQHEAYLNQMDPVSDNFLKVKNPDGTERIVLLDWEYASVFDDLFSLTGFCLYTGNDRAWVDRMIDLFYETAGETCSEEDRTLIYCYMAAAALMWTAWSEAKRFKGVDFAEYSMTQYRYAKDFYRYAVERINQRS